MHLLYNLVPSQLIHIILGKNAYINFVGHFALLTHKFNHRACTVLILLHSYSI